MKQVKEKKKLSNSRKLELIIAACLYYSGLVNLACWWMQRSGRKLVILCYHRMDGGSLREHLLYFRRHYRVLHLEAALEELYSPYKDEQQKKDQRPLLALAFDDGYRDHYTYGMGVTSELQVPVTIFLIPGYIENRKRFWWQEPEHLLRHTQLKEATFQGVTYHLDNLEEKQVLMQTLWSGVWNASSVAEREAFLETARTALAIPLLAVPQEQEQTQFPLDWTEVSEMEKYEWVSFGAHTMNHPVLTYLADPLELQYEVSECRTILEKQLKHPIRVFAYPVGKREHISEKVIHAVQVAGYNWAVTTIHGQNTLQTDPYVLYRIVVDVDQHWLMVAAKTSGLWDFLVNLGRKPTLFLRNILRKS